MSRCAFIAIAAVAASLNAFSIAAASTWSVSGQGSSTAGGFDFGQFQVQLGDPSGSAGATTAGGIPLVLTRTATTFSVSGSYNTSDGECGDAGSFAGTAPIQGGGGAASASGSISGTGAEDCGSGPMPYTITGSFSAQSTDAVAPPPVAASVAAVSGTVVVKTLFETQPVTPGAQIAQGTLVQTGGDGNITLDVVGGTRVSAPPNTQVTLLPTSGGASVVNQIAGVLSHSRQSSSGADAGKYRVQTATATLRPTGTEFTTRYTQTGSVGSTIVSVQSGVVEVTNRRGQLTTLVAGAPAAFDDAVPRVLLILPVHEDTVQEGRVNTFSWTAFPGAAGYLFEYTLRSTGFALQNSPAPEDLRRAPRLVPPAIVQTGQTVEFPLFIPVGLAPKGTRAQWRIFPVDPVGAILPGATASDASTETIQ